MLPLGQIVLNFHRYAEDTQLYVLLTGNYIFSYVKSFPSDIEYWMLQNFPLLNESKSEIVPFGPQTPSCDLKRNLGHLSSNMKHSACNVGVIFASELCFDIQIGKIVQPRFLQLRNISCKWLNSYVFILYFTESTFSNKGFT